MIDLGVMIRKRYELDLTQKVLSQMICVPPSCLAKWEAGIVEPGPFRLRRWCHELGVNVSEVKND